MTEKFGLKIFLNNEQIRANGMMRFIVEIGIIRFAFPSAVLFGIVMYVLNYGLTSPTIGELFTGRKISYFLLKVIIEGVTFGLIMWFWGKHENYPKLNQ